MDPTDEIITIMVTTESGEKQGLHVHRGTLCKSSAFFQKALKPEWATSRDRPDTIELSEDSVQTVSDYIKWLYTDHVPITLYKPRKGREKVDKEAEKVFIIIAEAYILAERIMDVCYKNAITKTMQAAREHSGIMMGLSVIEIIYKGTPSTSPLRRLIADDIACSARGDSNSWMLFIDACPKEVLVDAFKATVKKRSSPRDNAYSSISPYLEEAETGGDTQKTD